MTTNVPRFKRLCMYVSKGSLCCMSECVRKVDMGIFYYFKTLDIFPLRNQLVRLLDTDHKENTFRKTLVNIDNRFLKSDPQPKLIGKKGRKTENIDIKH